MALNACGQLCKCFLIIFNVILALVGLAMFALSVWMMVPDIRRGIIINPNIVVFVSVLIVLGVVLLLVAHFGDYGACKGNRTALGVFSLLLSILAVLQIAAGVIAYITGNEVGEHIANFYVTVYSQYATKGDPVMSVNLTIIQKATPLAETDFIVLWMGGTSFGQRMVDAENEALGVQREWEGYGGLGDIMTGTAEIQTKQYISGAGQKERMSFSE